MVNPSPDISLSGKKTAGTELDYEEDEDIDRNKRDLQSLNLCEQVIPTESNELVNEVVNQESAFLGVDKQLRDLNFELAEEIVAN